MASRELTSKPAVVIGTEPSLPVSPPSRRVEPAARN
jgi:hypothetical protein